MPSSSVDSPSVAQTNANISVTHIAIKKATISIRKFLLPLLSQPPTLGTIPECLVFDVHLNPVF